MGVRLIVSAEDTIETLTETLANLNLEAKTERRRGYAGVNGHRYASLHSAMNTLLDEIVLRIALGLK